MSGAAPPPANRLENFLGGVAPPPAKSLADLVSGAAPPPANRFENMLNGGSATSPSSVFVSVAADLGRLVTIARKDMRLSQQQFADLAGVGRRFISELENGKSTLEFGLVLQVCRAAGIDINAKRRQNR